MNKKPCRIGRNSPITPKTKKNHPTMSLRIRFTTGVMYVGLGSDATFFSISE
jgi:hypothetical protein